MRRQRDLGVHAAVTSQFTTVNMYTIPSEVSREEHTLTHSWRHSKSRLSVTVPSLRSFPLCLPFISLLHTFYAPLQSISPFLSLSPHPSICQPPPAMGGQTQPPVYGNAVLCIHQPVSNTVFARTHIGNNNPV